MANIQHADLTSIHRFASVANTDPGAIGAYKGWVDTSTTPYQLRIRNTGNTAWNDIGSIYTGANIGTGIGLFKQVSSGQFQFKKLEGGATSSIVVANHPTDVDSVAIDVVPANVLLSTLGGTLLSSKVVMDSGFVLGRISAGTGAVEQIALSNGLAFGSGVLGISSYLGHLDSNFTVNGVFTTFLEVLGLTGGSIWSINAYIPFTASNIHPQFRIIAGASITSYIADWEFVATAFNTSGATPVIRTSRSTAMSDIMDFGDMDATEGYVKIHGTIYTNTSGKLSFQTQYSSIGSSSTALLKGTTIILNKVG